MALNDWRFIITDAYCKPVGELLNAADRQLSISLSKVDTASFSIRTDHPMADQVLSLEAYLKIYRNDQLKFFGPLTDATESVQEAEGRITANAAAPAWILTERFPQITSTPMVMPAGFDRAVIALSILDYMNKQYFTSAYGLAQGGDGSYSGSVFYLPQFRETGHTMIRSSSPSYGASAGSTLGASYIVPAFKPYMEILNELAAGINGFDWRFMPIELLPGGTGATTPVISEMWAAPVIGTTRPEAIFEFGDGKLNVKSYTRTRSRLTQANSVRHLLSGSNEAAPPYAAATGTWGRWGIMEDIAQADLTDPALRQQLVNEHVTVRTLPRHTIIFEPTPDYGVGRLPRYDIDYTVGDIVTARALSLGQERFNAKFRVWSVEFTIDEFGVETPQLTLDSQGS